MWYRRNVLKCAASKTGTFLPDYVASHPRRCCSSVTVMRTWKKLGLALKTDNLLQSVCGPADKHDLQPQRRWTGQASRAVQASMCPETAHIEWWRRWRLGWSGTASELSNSNWHRDKVFISLLEPRGNIGTPFTYLHSFHSYQWIT